MLKSLMMQLRTTKTWFGKMRALAMMAIFCLVASPAFASSCCCDQKGEVGHSHNSPSDSTSVHAHISSEHLSHSSAQASVSASCNHQQCEASALVLVSRENPNIVAPLLALSVRPVSLVCPRTIVAAVFENAVAHARAPDRWASSGLSPPAFFTS